MKPLPTVLLGMALALAIGFFVGRGTQVRERDSASPAQATPPREADSPRESSERSLVKVEEQIAQLLEGNVAGVPPELTAFLTKIPTLDLTELEVALAKLSKTSNGSENWQRRMLLLTALYQRFGELDPEAALTHASKLQGWECETAFGAIFLALAPSGGETGWNLASSLPDGPLRKRARQSALNAMAKQDAGTAYAHWKQNKMLDPTSIFAAWAGDDPEAAFQAALKLGGTNRDGIIGAIVSQWFKSSPEAALARLQELPATQQRVATNSIMDTWIKEDPAEASAWLAKHPEFINRQSLRFLAEWTGTSPQEALQWSEENLSGFERVYGLKLIFGRWITSSPKEATAWLATIERASDREEIMEGSLWHVAWADPEYALKLVNEVGDGGRMAGSVEVALRRLAENDLAKARTLAEGITSPAVRDRALTRLVESWSASDPESAFAYAQGQSDPALRRSLISQVVETLASTAPKQALDLAEQLELGQTRSTAMSTALRSWATQSPVEAAAYARTIADPLTRDTAYQNVLNSWSAQDPASAARFLATLEPSAGLENAASSIGRQWAQRDPEAAYRWAAELPESSVHREAFEGIFKSWAGQDPGTAARVFAASKFGPEHAETARSIASQWASRDLPATLNWATALGDEFSQSKAYAEIATTWARDSPEDAGAWLGVLPEGTPRDTAITAYTREMLTADPANSLAWAATIGDREKRWETVKGLAHTWYQRNPEAAEAWMDEQELNPQERAEILDPMR